MFTTISNLQAAIIIMVFACLIQWCIIGVLTYYDIRDKRFYRLRKNITFVLCAFWPAVYLIEFVKLFKAQN